MPKTARLSPQADTIMEHVRGVVGKRWFIRRTEMMRILDSLQAAGILTPESGWLPGITSQEALSRAWGEACWGCTMVCIAPGSEAGEPADIRYDQPGTMAPYQHSLVIFATPGAASGDGTFDWLRSHCGRLLVVGK